MNNIAAALLGPLRVNFLLTSELRGWMLAAVMTLSPLSLNHALILSDSMELIELRAGRTNSLQLTELIESTELTAKKVKS